MQNILDFYQNIPLHITPTAFKIGFFQVGWYPLSYVVAFFIIYGLLIYRISRKEDSTQISNYLISNLPNKIPNTKYQTNYKLQTTNYKPLDLFFLYAIFGLLIGARLGYVFFYNLPYYLNHPLEIISPYDFQNHTWIGIYGMSYHGGLIGVILAAWIFCRRYKTGFLKWADFVVPAIPAGYFFGRIGNFLNGELYGRITEKSWGMYFGDSLALRYPSQLIEAILEGLLIFIILWPLRNRKFFEGKLLYLYILLYGLARFLAEFFREPDEQIGYVFEYFTLGQTFSLIMIFGGMLLFFCSYFFQESGIIKNK